MKRLLSFFLLTVLTCTILDSCDHLQGTSYIGEYAGSIKSSVPDNPAGYSAFYIDLVLYDDNSCILLTAVVRKEDNTLDEVRRQNCRYDNVTSSGFDVINESGAVVATAIYNGPFNFPDGEILLTWNKSLCTEWTQYADACGWEQPCQMKFYNNNGSDIKGW